MLNYSDLRLRRFRKNQTIRDMFALSMPPPKKLIWPVFIVEGKDVKNPIKNMPNQFRMSVDELLKEVEKVVSFGVGGIMIFAVPENRSLKSENGSYSYFENGITQTAVRAVKHTFPNLFVATDVCLCSYTPHGHCGIIDFDGNVLNDETNEVLAKQSLSHAAAGADCVAPSAMMDGQVRCIRNILNENKFHDVILMSYSTKFSSSMYGPFREAADSAPTYGDRKSYQADFRNSQTAILESLLDEAEGADILMVKPALFYLDIINKIKERTLLPLAAYNVSGEYSMIHASASCGYGDLYPMARESLMSIKRAGADIILSYWANQYDKILAF